MAKRSRDEDFEEPSSPDSEIIDRSSLSEAAEPKSTPKPAPSLSSKIIHLDQESGEDQSVMRCSLPGHRLTLSFASYDEYEVHYNKSHLNRCLECRKNFPTEHYLNLHIEENHDSFVSARKDRGEKIYSCFVEDCDRKCSTPQKRRMHLVDKHMFPQQYDFFVVNDGIDHRSSMLRSGWHGHRRRSSAAQVKMEEARQRSAMLENQTSPDCAEEKEPTNNDTNSTIAPAGDDMEGLEKAMSSLKFIPSSVRFGRGRGRGRGGFSRT